MRRTILITGTLLSLAAAGPLIAETERRAMDDFDAVAYALPFEVEFVVADEHFVELAGDADTIGEISTRVEGGTLKVYKENSWFDWSDDEIVLTIGYAQLSAIRMAGSGNGFARDVDAGDLELKVSGSADLEIDGVRANRLSVAISGSGSVSLNDVEADAIDSRISGSGDIDLSGRVISQAISISGSGDHRATALRTQDTTAQVRGSGDVGVWAEARLSASVVGSGDIEYYGNPSISESIVGSGELVRLGDSP